MSVDDNAKFCGEKCKSPHFLKNKLITIEICNQVLIVHVIYMMSVPEKQRNILNFVDFTKFEKKKWHFRNMNQWFGKWSLNS